MGNATGVLASEAHKPPDASDLATLEVAKAEVVRLRKLFREGLSDQPQSPTASKVGTPLLLIQATAAKAALGPLLLEDELLRKAVEEEVRAGPGGSRQRFEQDRAKKLRQKLRSRIVSAQERLTQLRVKAARRVGRAAEETRVMYEAVLTHVDPDGSGNASFTTAANEISNVGELRVGQEVLVPRNGRLVRARVTKLDDVDDVDHQSKPGQHAVVVVSVWNVVSTAGVSHEEGYDTANRIICELPRVDICDVHRELTQECTTVAPGTSPLDVEYLLAMLDDAAQSNELLVRLGQQVVTAASGFFGSDEAVQALNAPLKKMRRIMTKTAEKYNGDFSRVCDLARMTLACADFAAATFTLKMLQDSPEVEIRRIKNRLRLDFDATLTGGYRDCLVNVRDVANGHIAEVQITLRGLLDVKSGSGHAQYQLIRMLQLNDPATTSYDGPLTRAVIDQVKFGLVKTLVSHAGIAEHFDDLVDALKAPTCMLTVLDLERYEAGAGAAAGTDAGADAFIGMRSA